MKVKTLIHSKLNDITFDDYNTSIKKIDKYQFVSFDVFDTLIKRDLANPKDLFTIIEKKYKINNFYYKRVEAEKKARTVSGKKDISLTEIYQQYSSDEEINIRLNDLEIEEEKRICAANQQIFKIYDYCLKKGKAIFIISDMYLSKSVIEDILNRNGITGYKGLYVSNEVNAIKSDGSLFKCVCKENSIKSCQLLHIGNDIVNDYKGAIKAGVSAIKIPTRYSTTITNYSKKSSLALSKLEKSRLKELAAFLNNHEYQYKDYYSKFGYEKFGPLLYGFCRWIDEKVKKYNIQQIFFMARDGYIVKKVYELLHPDTTINIVYFEMSRRSIRVPSTNDKDLDFNEMFSILPLLGRGSMKQVFDSWGLNINKYAKILEQHNFSIDYTFWREELETNQDFISLYYDVKPDIIANANDEKEALGKK